MSTESSLAFPVSSARQQMETAFAECTRVHPVRLVGSWATREAHLPQHRAGIIESLSDVDLIATEECCQNVQEEIRLKLKEAALMAGVRINRVSIRLEDEFNDLPHSCVWDSSAKSRLLQGDRQKILYFWTAIAAIESAIAANRRHHDTAELMAYVGAKFVFTVLRTLALLSGDVISCYRDLCLWIDRRWGDVPTTELYRIKTGSLSQLQPSLIDAMLGDRILSDVFGRSDAFTIGCELRAFCSETRPLRPFGYAEIAHRCAPNKASYVVLSYELAKLNHSLRSRERDREENA